MAIEKVSAWRTSDGTWHETEEAAREHEAVKGIEQDLKGMVDEIGWEWDQGVLVLLAKEIHKRWAIVRR